jgi:SpoVK/Ycf46/Vps4 family AAA+-type ATPase
VASITYHCVFTGNPGTGKTTVARLLAQIFKALGLLSKGHLVETDRSGLVGGYVGQTALKTSSVVQSAVGGILFVDEAYALANPGENDYGREAVDTLLKLMEDNRDDLVVIVAGYPELMERFVQSNPGLRSRFARYIDFPDYDPPSLLEILLRQAKESGYQLASDAVAAAERVITAEYESRSQGFGNGRFVRNLFESMLANQANRLASFEAPTRDDLMTLTASDVNGSVG